MNDLDRYEQMTQKLERLAEELISSGRQDTTPLGAVIEDAGNRLKKILEEA